MAIFNVHIYREMRLVFGAIEADTHEAAAAIARDKPTGDADAIDDCEGETLSALVDVQGDEEYENSRLIDFDGELVRHSAPNLLDALKISEGFVQWALDHGADSDGTSAALSLIRTTIAEAEAADIPSQPSGANLLAALDAVLPYAEAERASLENCYRRDNDASIKDELDRCGRVLARVRAAISSELTARLPSAPTSAATEMYDTLRYVAETLAGFKPDYLKQLGLDAVLEKTEAALQAAETFGVQEGDHGHR